MDIMTLLVSLASGALGGNLTGSTIRDEENLGTVGNSVAGLFGGGVGHALLTAFGLLSGVAGQEFNIMSLLTNVGASGLCGAAVPYLISFVRGFFTKR